MSWAIYMKESRYQLVANISGALLHGDITKDVHMLFEGTIAELRMQ